MYAGSHTISLHNRTLSEHLPVPEVSTATREHRGAEPAATTANHAQVLKKENNASKENGCIFSPILGPQLQDNWCFNKKSTQHSHPEKTDLNFLIYE